MQNQEPFYFAPQPKFGGGWVCFKDSPSPPPAPDYTGAATATSQGSAQAAIANALLNQRNTYTPLGSQTFTQNGSTSVPGIGGQPGFEIPKYDQSINMTPEGQNLYNQQMGLSTGLMGLGQTSLDQTRASLGQPQDFNSVQDIADQSYGMQTQRLDPQWAQNQQTMDAKLADQGIPVGSEAHANAMREFGQNKNDAYNQARLSSIGTMPTTFQLSTAQRMQPLTELNAIRSGAQPQMPQFQPVPAAGGVQGPNMMGAAQAQSGYDMGLYNSQVGSQNSMMSGLMGLGSAAMPFFGGAGAAATAISDRRLKRDIVRVADDPRGFGWYSFKYLWNDETQIGVMADEVPHASIRHPSGFMMVDYARL